jgi:hypothetical protein
MTPGAWLGEKVRMSDVQPGTFGGQKGDWIQSPEEKCFWDTNSVDNCFTYSAVYGKPRHMEKGIRCM